MRADAATFDQLFESAYLRRDVAFVEAAVADDVSFAVDPGPNARPMTKRELVDAARQWQFLPGTHNGEPVAAIVSMSMTFTLRK